MSLPAPSANQAYCDVSALEAGHLSLPTALILDGFPKDERVLVPSLSFLIRHASTNATLVFDLGIRTDYENYPPAALASIRTYFPSQVPQDAAASLRAGGADPGQIAHVCYSHLHWDHVGDPAPFTRATFLVGAACKPLVDGGYPARADAAVAADLLPPGRTRFLAPDAWPPLGPFAHALDLWGDGSVYVVDAPGHMPGHVNILARTSADGGWVYLAGDGAHDWRLLTGGARIARAGGAYGCVHADADGAAAHIERMKRLVEYPRVRVLLAHDIPWYEANKGGAAFWPGKIESL